MEEISDALKGQGMDAGEPEPADPLADAADSPLGPDEIQAGLHFVSVVLDAGTSALSFATALIGLIKAASGKPTVKLIDAGSGKTVTEVEETSDPATIAQRLSG